MNNWLLFACAALRAGSEVSKDLYQSEVVKAQELEVRSGDLQARLDAETAQRKGMERRIDQEQRGRHPAEHAAERKGRRGEQEDERQIEQRARDRETRVTDHFRRAGVDELTLRTDEDYAQNLLGFFRKRERRMR